MLDSLPDVTPAIEHRIWEDEKAQFTGSGGRLYFFKNAQTEIQIRYFYRIILEP